jgi:hypothetical protein
MTTISIFLPLIVVILGVKVKIIWKTIIRKRWGTGPAQSRAGPPLGPHLPSMRTCYVPC